MILEQTLATHDIEVDAFTQEGFESRGKRLDVERTIKNSSEDDHANRIHAPPTRSWR